MTRLNFSFFSESTKQTHDVQVFVPKKIQIKDAELKKRIEAGALHIIGQSAQKPVKGPISIKVTDKHVFAKVGTNQWEKVELPSGTTPSQGTLSRVLGESVMLKDLEATRTPIGAFFKGLVDQLTALFHFITRSKPEFPVPLSLLQEVIGPFPKNGEVTLSQALSYWIQVLDTYEAETEENKTLKDELKACQKITADIENLGWQEGSSFESSCSRLIDSISSRFDRLEEGQKILIPTGFWNQALERQDCLLEVRKEQGSYTVSAFSLNPDIAEKSVMYVQKKVSLDEIKSKVPWMIALRLPQTGLALPKPDKNKFIFFRIAAFFARKKLFKTFRSQQAGPVQAAALVRSLLPKSISLPTPPSGLREKGLVNFALQKLAQSGLQTIGYTAEDVMQILGFDATQTMVEIKKGAGRASEITRAEGVVRTFIRAQHEDKQEYKVVRLSAEVDLLLKATKEGKWLSDSEYRNTVYQSAIKLLMDLEGIRQGKVAAGATLSAGSKRAADELKALEEKLLTIRDEAETYGKTVAKKAAQEKLKETEIGKVSLETTIVPGKEKVTHTASDLPISVISGEKIDPQNAEACLAKLKEGADLCSQLAERGEYALLEHVYTLFALSIPLLNENGKKSFEHFSAEQAQVAIESLKKIQQAACWCCLLGTHSEQPHPDNMLALLSLQAAMHQLTERRLNMALPWTYYDSDATRLKNFLENMRELPLLSARSALIDKRFKELSTYRKKISNEDNPGLLKNFREDVYKNEAFKAFLDQSLINTSVLFGFSTQDTHWYRPFSAKNVSLVKMATPIFRELVSGIIEKRHQNQAKKIIREYLAKHAGKPPPGPLTIEESPDPFKAMVIPVLGLAFGGDARSREHMKEKINRLLFQLTKSPSSRIEELYTQYDDKFRVYKAANHDDDFDRLMLCKKELTVEIFKDLSYDERRAILFLFPDPNITSYFTSMTANIMSFIEQYPQLLTNPKIEVHIDRTLFQLTEWNQENVQKHKTQIQDILEALQSLENSHKKEGNQREAIRIAALSCKICQKASCVPEVIPEGLRLRNWVQDIAAIALSRNAKFLADEEILGILHEKYFSALTPESIKDNSVKQDITQFLTSWFFVNNKEGHQEDVDLSLQREGQRFLLQLCALYKDDPSFLESILKAVSTVFPEEKIPKSGWKIGFPETSCEPFLVNVFDGKVFKNGMCTSFLPHKVHESIQDIDTSGLWNCSRTKKENMIVEEYIKENDLEKRILVQRNELGVIQSIALQKHVEGSWYQRMAPSFTKETTMADAVRSVLDTIFAKESEVKQLTLPASLKPFVGDKNIWVEIGDVPKKILSDDGKAVFVLKENLVDTIFYEGKKVGILGEEAKAFFEALDTNVIGAEENKKKTVVYTRAFLRRTDKATSPPITVQMRGEGWEFTDLPGFLCLGSSQPISTKKRVEEGLHSIIPPGVSQFLLLQKEDGKEQKVLMPLTSFKHAFEGAVRGREDTSRKQFSRFQTQIEAVVDEENLPVVAFDVDQQKERLVSSDPVANAYLAYVYLTQQRYSDAVSYLNVCRTGTTPPKELETIIENILHWPDDSLEGKAFRLKALVHVGNWSSEKAISVPKRIEEVLSHCQGREELNKIFEFLDDGEKRSLIYTFKLPSFPDGLQLRAASAEGAAHVVKKTPQNKVSRPEPSSLIEKLEPAKPLDKKKFIVQLSVSPDGCLKEQLLSILATIEDEDIREAIRTCIPKSETGRYLKDVLQLADNNQKIIMTKDKKANERSIASLFASLESNKKKSVSESVSPEKGLFAATIMDLAKGPLPSIVSKQDCIRGLEASLPPESSHILETPPSKALIQQPLEKPLSLFESINLTSVTNALEDVVEPLKLDNKEATQAFFNGFSDRSKKTLEKELADLQEDTIYAGTRESAAVRQEKMDEAKAALENAKTALVEQERKNKHELMSKLRPSFPTGGGLETWHKKLKMALSPEEKELTLERLLGAYVRQQTGEVLKEYGIEVPVSEIETLVEAYLDTSVALQHVQKTIQDFPQPDSTPEKKYSVSDREFVAEALSGKRYFDPNGPQGRLLRMIEYSNGYLLRPKNIELVNTLLSKDKNCIRQLPPGSGKTEVVLRLIAIMQADGYHVPCIILPDWLFETQGNEIDKGVRDLIQQNSYLLKVPQGRDMSVGELEDMYIKIEKAIANRQVIQSTRSHLLNLKNLFDYYDNRCADSSLSLEKRMEFFEKYKKTAQILVLIKERGKAFCDEVDSLQNIHEQVNKKSDAGELIELWKQQSCVDLYEILLKSQEGPLHKLSLAIQKNTHVDLQKKEVEDGLTAWAKAFCKEKGFDEETFLPYLLTGKIEGNVLDTMPQKRKEELVAAKVFLSETLPLSLLRKAGGVKGGYGKHADPAKVGPYKGPKTPDELSEYCDEFELLGFCVQEYIENGITFGQAKKILQHEYDAIQKEWRQAQQTNETLKMSETDRARTLCSFCGLSFAELFSEDCEAGSKKLVEKLQENPLTRLQFCNSFIFPTIRKSTRQESSSSFDLVDMFGAFHGITGTPFNIDTFHDDIEKTAESKLKGSDGKTIAAVMEKKIRFVDLDAKKTLQEAVIDTVKDYNGVIDIGAYCRDTEPTVLAHEAAEKLTDNENFIVFIDKDGSIKACGKPVVDKNGIKHPGAVCDFDPKSQDMSPDKTKTLFQVFIGANIKQTPDAKFLVTIGNKAFLKDFIQGVMRLRRLPQGQTFDIALSEDIRKTIAESVDKPLESITTQDILAYCLTNETEAMKEDVLAAEKEKILRRPRIAFFEARMRYAASKNPLLETVTAIHSDSFVRDLISPSTEKTLENLQAPAQPLVVEKSLQLCVNKANADFKHLRALQTVQQLGYDPFLEKRHNDLLTRIPTDIHKMPVEDRNAEGTEERGRTATVEQQRQQVVTATETVVTTAVATAEVTADIKKPHSNDIFPEYTHNVRWGNQEEYTRTEGARDRDRKEVLSVFDLAERQTPTSAEAKIAKQLSQKEITVYKMFFPIPPVISAERLAEEDNMVKPDVGAMMINDKIQKHFGKIQNIFKNNIFDQQFLISPNILVGFQQQFLKEIQHAVFSMRNGVPRLYMLDSFDFQQFLSQADALEGEKLYGVEIGTKLHFVSQVPSEEEQKGLLRLVVQAKLLRGELSYTEEERVVLKEFIREKGPEAVEDFVNNNPYMTPFGKEQYRQKRCDLARMIDELRT